MLVTLTRWDDTPLCLNPERVRSVAPNFSDPDAQTIVSFAKDEHIIVLGLWSDIRDQLNAASR